MKKKIEFTRHQRIVHTLMLQASCSMPDGFSMGRTGIALYLYYAGRLLQEPNYTAYVKELTEIILSSLTQGVSVDFKNGLIGIGWFVEHLFRQGFEEGDRDEVLESLDHWIKQTFESSANELSCIELFVYFSERLSGRSSLNCPAELLLTFESVLDRMLENRQWIEEMEKGKTQFDLLWAYPWMIYYVRRMLSEGYVHDKLYKLKKLLETCMPNMNGAGTSSGNRLLLDLVRGIGISSDSRQFLNDESHLPYEQAWLIILLYIFAREEGRDEILSLYEQLYALDKGDSYCAGFRPDGGSGFSLGLYRGIAGIGLAGLLAESLKE